MSSLGSRMAAVLAVAVAALAFAILSGPVRVATAQANTRPAECICSDSAAIPGLGARIANCQCGALQCAVTERGTSNLLHCK